MASIDDLTNVVEVGEVGTRRHTVVMPKSKKNVNPDNMVVADNSSDDEVSIDVTTEHVTEEEEEVTAINTTSGDDDEYIPDEFDSDLDESELEDEFEEEEEDGVDEEPEVSTAPDLPAVEANTFDGEDVNMNPGEVIEQEEEDTSIDDFELDDNTEGEEKVIFEDEDDKAQEESDESQDDDEATEREETIKRLRSEATKKLKPVMTNLDLSSFTIVKKPSSNISSIEETSKYKVAKWVAYSQKISILMKEFNGADIEAIRSHTEAGERFLRQGSGSDSNLEYTSRYRIIYDHLMSPKPKSFEAWLKSTPYSDTSDYFFATHIATYRDTNFFLLDCSDQTKCKNTFITDEIPIMDMVEYPDNDVKETFSKIYKSEPVPNESGLYVTEVVPISRDIAVGFKEASIYDYLMAISIEGSAFAEKYASIKDYVPYIDNVYRINYETQELNPIIYKEYVNNPSKTYRSKIQKYNKVFNTLSADQLGSIAACIRGISENDKRPTYCIPEITCPKCGKTREKMENVEAEYILFLRHQLAQLVNTPLSSSN